MRSCTTKNRHAGASGASRIRIGISASILLIATGVFVGNCSASRALVAQAPADPYAALRSGDYAGARAGFEVALKSNPNDEQAQAGLLRTLEETGAYEEGSRRADAFLSKREGSAALHVAAGRLAAARGDAAAAERHLRRTVALGGPARLEATRRLADLLEDRGRSGEAESLWESLIEEYRGGKVRGSEGLGNAAVAAWRRGYVQDAKDIFMDATDEKAGPVSLQALSDFGDLFLEKYNATDAIGVFRDCLKINKTYPAALMGMARAKQYENDAEVDQYARAALGVNPNLVSALDLVAELRIQDEDYDAALEEIQRALAVSPNSLESLSLRAVCNYFKLDTAAFAETEKKVLGINPRYGRFYHTLAENLVSRRKYQESVDFNRKALSLDPQLSPACLSLGMNLTRVGRLDEGRKYIQQAFEGDPFNVWAYNTLELLDQMDKFATAKARHFSFRMSAEDEPVLSAYAPRLADEAYDKLSKRYGFSPRVPLEVEIFPDHGGFAVRTLGLPGLGAVGVCFGQVIALDSPRARKLGSFNWGSTLWHEFTHVVTLQMTNHNIPRWYSEGLSVYEERRARPGWGDHLTAGFLRAYKDGKLLKVSELNSGMMRPRFPEQVLFSYYQASLFCELVEEKFGFDKIRQTLALFAQDKPSAAVFQEALGWDPATMDREYASYLDRKLAGLAAHLDARRPDRGAGAAAPDDKATLARRLAEDPDDFFANLQMGLALRSEGSNQAAEPYLLRAQKVFPQYVEADNPYQALSEMYAAANREDDALAQLKGWADHDGESAVPLTKAAEIYRKRKDWAAASNALALAVYINPYDPDIHAMLGGAASEAGNWPDAVAAWQVVLALNPTDPAEAHYSLARAWLGSGNARDAKREVLRALEIAPSFEKAQRLLLQLSGK
jgi:cellulose synthase operon protein C